MSIARSFHLQDNNVHFGGVDRFRLYGELLDPELSNLHIVTVALGLRILSKSSIEFLYHHYRQVRRADFLRDHDFKRDPNGLSRRIGDEWDLVIGIEEWEHVEVELIGALARPYPFRVITRLLGLPMEANEKFLEWAVQLINYPWDPEAASSASAQFTNYLRPLVVERRRKPGEDLLSLLATEEVEGQPDLRGGRRVSTVDRPGSACRGRGSARAPGLHR